jgi:pantoate--beta-alanine ligase
VSHPELLEGLHAARDWRARIETGRTVGLVPTMGALHEGHLSLVRAAEEECDLVAVSVYVNPLQFAPGEDLEAYPRDLEADRRLAGEAGCDVLAVFADTEMYPPGFSTYVDVEGLASGLCGKSRPGHFRGVTTVVTKLFHILAPSLAYFGQKDAQQAAVIRRMTADLDFGTKIRILPTVREEDGLAMSSRNAYLTAEERAKAPCLFAALNRAKELAASGERDTEVLQGAMRDVIVEDGGEDAVIEYIEIVDPLTMKPLVKVDESALAAVAVKLGPARLIDNLLLIG